MLQNIFIGNKTDWGICALAKSHNWQHYKVMHDSLRFVIVALIS